MNGLEDLEGNALRDARKRGFCGRKTIPFWGLSLYAAAANARGIVFRNAVFEALATAREERRIGAQSESIFLTSKPSCAKRGKFHANGVREKVWAKLRREWEFREVEAGIWDHGA